MAHRSPWDGGGRDDERTWGSSDSPESFESGSGSEYGWSSREEDPGRERRRTGPGGHGNYASGAERGGYSGTSGQRGYPGANERGGFSGANERGGYQRPGERGSHAGGPGGRSGGYSSGAGGRYGTGERGGYSGSGEYGGSFGRGEGRFSSGSQYGGYESGLDEGRFQTRPSDFGRSGAGPMPGSLTRPRNRGPKNWQRSDERIQDDICERLSAEPEVDASEVDVSVQQGKVTLSGTVTDRRMKHRIEDIADDCSGVRDVDNRLRVRSGDRGSRSGGFWQELFGFQSGAKASDVMTREVLVVSPQDTVQRAAQIMKDADVGAVPVCDGRKLQGMITDRDITIRAVAAGRAAGETRVSDAMTSDVFWCYEDDEIDDVLDKMGNRQVRRIPVVDRDKNLAGIISLGDVATRRSDTQVEGTLEEISEPGQVRH